MINLDKKVALVTGVADNVGFGWHIAKTLQAAGAEVILSCHPRVTTILERFLTKDKYQESRHLPFGQGDFSPTSVVPCDVTIDNINGLSAENSEQKGYNNGDVSINGLVETIKKQKVNIDIIIHSVAFSPEVTKSHIDVSRGAYLTALSASSYSLVALTKALAPLMNTKTGSTIVGLTYLAAERAVPFYGGGMASAKAALECDARMLSWFIGENKHRINLVSAGPYASRAAKSIGDIDEMINSIATKSPLRRPITAQEVANTVLFLCSDLSSGITGEVIHVDAGYHAMGV